MPKKFTGVNTKSVKSREKKKQSNEDKQNEHAKVVEDEKWNDNDKLKQRKQEKEEKELKKKEEMKKKKLEAQAQLEKEVESIKVKKTKQQNKKPTKTEIRSKPEEKKKIHSVVPLEENFNKFKIEEEIATTIDEAILVLSGPQQEDKHPEKRMKAAYKKFEERRLNELKTTNPTLKLSQLKQMVFKEWKTSPENPMLQK